MNRFQGNTKDLRSRIFIGPYFVTFYRGGRICVGSTWDEKAAMIASFDDILPGSTPPARYFDNPTTNATLNHAFDLTHRSSDFPNASSREKAFNAFRDKVIARIISSDDHFLLNNSPSLRQAYEEKLDIFTGLAAEIPETTLVQKFCFVLDPGGDVSSVAPWHYPDKLDKAAGICSPPKRLLFIAIGKSFLETRKTTNHELTHAYDSEKGKISRWFFKGYAESDEKKIDGWFNTIARIRNGAPLFKGDAARLKRWTDMARPVFSPSELQERFAGSPDPYAAMLLDVYDTIKYGFKLDSPLYDKSRREFERGNTWPIRTENLAYFVELVRSYSEPSEYLSTNAPILHMTKLLAPRLTEFYANTYLGKHLIPDTHGQGRGVRQVIHARDRYQTDTGR